MIGDFCISILLPVPARPDKVGTERLLPGMELLLFNIVCGFEM